MVKAGDKVNAGQLLATGQGGSANIHAPQSGTVEKIAEHSAAIPGGGKQSMIHLLCDAQPESKYMLPPDYVKLDNNYQSREQLIDIIADAGIVGMGGAVFPAATKLRSTLNKDVDTLLINGCECEPYITCDYRLMRERAIQIIKGIKLAKEEFDFVTEYILVKILSASE